MRQSLKTLLIAASLLLAASPAYAGIPIPCTGETIVKVLDIDSVRGRKPGIAGLIERPIDLGYKFSGCTSGKWVGYTGESGRYLDLPEPLLKLLLLKAGRTEFPPAPSFMSTPSASWVVWMYIVLFIPAVLAGIFSKKDQSALASHDAPSASPDAQAEDPAPGIIGSARSVSGPAAAARHQAPLGPVAAAARARSPSIASRNPNNQARLGGQPSFGRRA